MTARVVPPTPLRYLRCVQAVTDLLNTLPKEKEADIIQLALAMRGLPGDARWAVIAGVRGPELQLRGPEMDVHRRQDVAGGPVVVGEVYLKMAEDGWRGRTFGRHGQVVRELAASQRRRRRRRTKSSAAAAASP